MKNSELNFSYFDYNSPNTIMRLKIADHYYHPDADVTKPSRDIETVLRESNLLINYEKFSLNQSNRQPYKNRMNLPRKSRSAASISNSTSQIHEKRQSDADRSYRYSAGDYLRQQIVEDLSSPDILYKSDEQIAIDRYNRVRAYLDQCRSRLCHPSDDNDSDIPGRIRRRYSDNQGRANRHSYGTRRANSDLATRLNNVMPFERRSTYRRTRSEFLGRNVDSFSMDNHGIRSPSTTISCPLGIRESSGEAADDETENDAKNLGRTIHSDCGSIRRRYSDNQSRGRRNRAARRANSDLTMRLSTWTEFDRTPGRSEFQQENLSDGFELARKILIKADPMKKTDCLIGEGLAETTDGENGGVKKAARDDEDLGQSTETETIVQENYLLPKDTRGQGVQDYVTSEVLMGWTIPRSLDDSSETMRMSDDHDYCLDNCEGHWLNNNSEESALGSDIAGDYFRRVYDVLKCPEDGNKDRSCDPAGSGDNSSSSSNFDLQRGRRKRRRRRRSRSRRSLRGEGVVVSPLQEGGWRLQLNSNNDDEEEGGNCHPFYRHNLSDSKPRPPPPPPPPIPAKYKINARDISKYFNYPNKENSPGYAVDRTDDISDKVMGSNLSRHSEKGLTGRRTQSSGNLCDPKGKLNHVGKILVPCSSGPQDRYKISGSLPNNLDDKDPLGDDPIDNNNVISDTISGNLGGTLPHKKSSRIHGVHFSDSPVGALDLVRYRSQDSLEGNPWRYHQDSDLDLVRCKHGNLDLVRKNQSIDTVDSKYTRVYDDSRYHQSNHLDLVGTLPKRRIDPKWCDPSSIQAFQQQAATTGVDTLDGDLLMKVVHKPDCELMKHRKMERLADIKTRLGSEPQDQGYASERSPEDEHPPSLPGQPLPHIKPESTFRVTLQKSSRGLGLSVSGGGSSGPVRVKRLFPQQPAALSNKLQPGDILLAANGVPLTGLTNYEALEVLRTTASSVELLVSRLPGEEQNISPPGAPPPPPARREQAPAAPLPLPPAKLVNPLLPLQIEPCGEFDLEMTKVAGSLGFTLRKVDSSALGHYVRALVREPALSDGRIQPGDKIVAVDGVALSPMSHEEAVSLLRQCGPRVKLRLYRDLAQTPVSALSPTEPDHPLRPPRTSLRQEAMDMLCDLAVRKLSPGTSGSRRLHNSGTLSNSPRRLRKPASKTPIAERDNEPIYSSKQVSTGSQVDTSDSDQCSIKTQITNSQSTSTTPNDIIDPPALYDASSDTVKPTFRPNFLNLGAGQEKPNYQFGLESEREETIIIPEHNKNPIDCMENSELPQEPASMPPLMSSIRTNSATFSYKNPAYQSANPTCSTADNSEKTKVAHSSEQDIPGKVLSVEDPGGTKGLLKWKGVMFAPEDEDEMDMSEPKERAKKREESLQRQGYDVFMVELTRGWNSRLGFSLQSEGNSTVISVVHPDSVAAKDGRLRQGDVLIMVNDESVERMPKPEIIDLLRKIRGSIGITVARKKRPGT